MSRTCSDTRVAQADQTGHAARHLLWLPQAPRVIRYEHGHACHAWRGRERECARARHRLHRSIARRRQARYARSPPRPAHRAGRRPRARTRETRRLPAPRRDGVWRGDYGLGRAGEGRRLGPPKLGGKVSPVKGQPKADRGRESRRLPSGRACVLG